MDTWIRRAFLAVILLGVFAFVAFAVLRSWWTHRASEAAMAALAPVAQDASSHLLEHQMGFSLRDTGSMPQVSAPGDPSSSRDSMWSAYEIDRREEEPALAPDARGVILEWTEGDTLSLDRLNAALPIERLARGADDIVWIAFTHRSTIEGVYTFGDHEALVQRIDVRVVRREGATLIGRLTAEGIPPISSPGGLGHRYDPQLDRVGDALLALLADTRAAEMEPMTPLPTTCFAQALPQLGDDLTYDVSCVDGATQACIERCRLGEPGSCLHAAWTLDHGWWHRPAELYRLACVGGSASGCTNFGATWLDLAAPDDPVAVPCSLELFERACTAGDSYACGMYGNTLVRDAGGDPSAARAQLEATCADVGYFACEVLAGLIDTGQLGPRDEAAMLRARQHGCDTGYAPSCARLPDPRAPGRAVVPPTLQPIP